MIEKHRPPRGSLGCRQGSRCLEQARDRIQHVAGCPPLMSGVQSTMSSVLLQSSEP
jgi:hypothetical protein